MVPDAGSGGLSERSLLRARVTPPRHLWERSEWVCPQGPELPGLALVLP